jgi:hypothetical protein
MKRIGFRLGYLPAILSFLAPVLLAVSPLFADFHPAEGPSSAGEPRPARECVDQNNCSGLRPCTHHSDRMRDALEILRKSGNLPDRRIAGDDPAAQDVPEALFDGIERRPDSGSPQTWTLLFYNDADFANAYNPYSDFILDAHSSAHVNVLMLEDRQYGPCKLWYVGSDHRPRLLENWGEVDMGHSNTLRKFINYGKTHYPADRYFLALYDHGGGWMGACSDVTNQGWLTMSDISTAIASSGGVDIIAFTAPCLMGALESAYQLRNCTDVYIGSEEISGYAAWIGIMGDVCDILNDSSDLSNVDIGEMVVDLVAANPYWPSHHDGAEWITMSAVESAKTNAVASQVDLFCGYAIPHMAKLFDGLKPAARAAWRMGQGGKYTVGEIDLYDFARRYVKFTSDPLAADRAQQLMSALDEAIVAEYHGWAQVWAYGLTIYFPRLRADYSRYYTTWDLAFVKNTQWDEFLRAYYQHEAKPVGSIAGVVCADRPSPDTPLQGVTMSAYDIGTGDLLKTTTTGCDGCYLIEDLKAGNLVVSMVTPLGCEADVDEWFTVVIGGDTTTINASLRRRDIVADTRGVGYWKHQVAVATGGNGRAQIPAGTLCEYLDKVEDHFINNGMNSIAVYNPPGTGGCMDKLEAARAILVLTGRETMARRARQHLMALLLNATAEKIALYEVISKDGATVSQAITYCYGLLMDMDAKNDVIAKDISEMINERNSVPSGMIPLATPDIAYAPVYRENETPPGFYLEQNYPNPFNPSTTIRFSLPERMHARLSVYDVAGRFVTMLLDEEMSSGLHTVPFDASSLAGGVYFYKLEAGGFVQARKTVITK